MQKLQNFRFCICEDSFIQQICFELHHSSGPWVYISKQNLCLYGAYIIVHGGRKTINKIDKLNIHRMFVCHEGTLGKGGNKGVIILNGMISTSLNEKVISEQT